MKKIKITDADCINKSIHVLENGGVIVYPTDTLYGFGVDATNDNAINRLNIIKGRSGPISVLAPDIETAIEWMAVTQFQSEIIKSYLGGKKTLITSVKNNIVSSKIIGSNNSLGIRIPRNDFCNKLAAQFAKPITSTSVNHTGEKPLNDPNSIEYSFGNEIDLLIDGGTLPNSIGSTVYQLKGSNIIILRK